MASGKRNLYDILGIRKDADQEEIHGAYRKHAKKYHPDASGNEKNHEKFLAVNQAYETLKDKGKRREYDRELDRQNSRTLRSRRRPEQNRRNPFSDIFGRESPFDEARFEQSGTRFDPWTQSKRNEEAGMRESLRGRSKGFGLSSVFGGLFRGMFEREAGDLFGRRDPETEPVSSYDLDVRVSPEEARNGCSSVIRVPVEVECPVCGGEGLLYRKWCWKCNGSGRLIQENGFRLRLPAGLTDGMQLRVTAQTPEPIEFRVTVHISP